jgi:hypothetical protein
MPFLKNLLKRIQLTLTVFSEKEDMELPEVEDCKTDYAISNVI